MSTDRSDLLLIVAPVGRDAELMCAQLRAAGLRCAVCKDVHDLCGRLVDGAGAIIVTEEALHAESAPELIRALATQPPWSEIPVVILTAALPLDFPGKQRPLELMGGRTNVTFVDRPVRVKSLISAAQSALRARERQYDIRDLMEQLEERVHERDRFLAVLGHELRNPLGAILLASQMIGDDGKLDGEYADLIERQSRHLTRLVNDLLDLSRVAAGKIVLKPQRLDLRDVVRQTAAVSEPAARRQRLELQVIVPPEPVMVRADPVRLDQIIGNILTNAIKYTPEGGHVTLVLERAEDSAQVRVTDDGVGIAPERIGGIFELFAQAENAIGRAQGGMGIGLALVRNLVQLHEGHVEAKSDGVGKGSEFVVRLPLLSAAENEAAPASAQQTSSAPTAARSIAIVEDNTDVRDLLRLRLSRLGHRVVTAQDGEEGLRLLIAERPDFALVDLGLPGMDGFAVAKEARRQLGDDVVLVAVSGFGQPEDKRRALDSGFDEHITKPAEVSDIENVLRRFPPRNTRPAGQV
ncbi:MAG TPA: hybrid sensor histidine kinase/response regulator [Thermoanaerobaculia bacterium]|nr:hybrid sensor histidine kinase/response regulator [Thermoanaerobaculia bacterium]